MESVSRKSCLISGIASLWAASAAMDWWFLPWGASGLGLALIVVILFGSMSLIVSFLSIRDLFSKGSASDIFLLFAIYSIFTVMEVVYFNIIPDDHEMLRRQMHGILLSPILAGLSSPALLGRRQTIGREWTRIQRLICAITLSILTIIFEFILLWIRGPASSAAYLGIDSSMFSVAILSLVALVAVASLRQ